MRAEKRDARKDCFLIDETSISTLKNIFGDIEAREKERIDQALKEYENGLREKTRTLFANLAEDREAEIQERLAEHRRSESRNLGVEIKISCSDKIDRSIKSFTDLLAYPNEAAKEIRQLAISTDYGSSTFCSITLNSDGYRAIDYKIRGEEEAVIVFSSRIENFISSIVPWYSKLHKIEGFYVGLLIYVLGGLFLTLYSIFWSVSQTDAVRSPLSIQQKLTLLGIFASPIALGFLWSRFLRFYPQGVFELNEGKKRQKSRIFWRRLIGGAVLLPVTLRLIFSVFQK